MLDGDERQDTDSSAVSASKHQRRMLILLLCLTAAAFIYYTFPLLKAMAVMSVVSSREIRDGSLQGGAVDIDIPGGWHTLRSDWFPLMLTYDDDGLYRRVTGTDDTHLTVLYSFPAYDLRARCSRLYAPATDYYNSFYGAYLVSSDSGRPVGFSESGGSLAVNTDELLQIPYIDYYYLVLSDFGLQQKDMIFECEVTEMTESLTYAGSDGWMRIDARLRVSGAAHEALDDVQSYYQYGAPGYDVPEAFAPADMYGRIYGKYLPEQNVSVFFYVVAGSEDIVNATDRDLLSHSKIR